MREEIEKAFETLDDAAHIAYTGMAEDPDWEKCQSALALLREELERVEQKASDTLAIQVRAEARAEKAEAELADLREMVDTMEKVADTYRLTIVKLGDERNALKAEVERLKDTNVWHQLCQKYEAELAAARYKSRLRSEKMADTKTGLEDTLTGKVKVNLQHLHETAVSILCDAREIDCRLFGPHPQSQSPEHLQDGLEGLTGVLGNGFEVLRVNLLEAMHLLRAIKNRL